MANRYYRDPKIAQVSDEAELLWLHGLAYSSEQETDGRVPGSALAALLVTRSERAEKRARKRARTCAAELVAAGLWEETDDGYAVPFETWSRWQETAEQRVAGRARAAEKKARQRARPQGTDPGTARASGVGAGAGAGHSPLPPAPIAPLARPPMAARGANGQTDELERIDVVAAIGLCPDCRLPFGQHDEGCPERDR